MSLTERIRAGRQASPATLHGPVEPAPIVLVTGEHPHARTVVRSPSSWVTRAHLGVLPPKDTSVHKSR